MGRFGLGLAVVLGILLVLGWAAIAYERSPARQAEILLRDMRGDPPNGLEAVRRFLGMSERRVDSVAWTEEMVSLGTGAIPVLARELNENRGAAGSAARALKRLGPPGQLVLCEALGHESHEVRSNAHSCLRDTNRYGLYEACIPKLGEHLLDARAEVREFALDGLPRHGVGSALHTRIATMLQRDRSPAVRRAAALALGRVDAPTDLQSRLLLATVLDAKEDPDVRAGALEGLGTRCIAMKDLVPICVQAIGDPAEEVRYVAAMELAWMEWRDAAESSEARAAVGALRRALEDPSAKVQSSAAETLGRMALAGVDIADAVPALKRLVKDEDHEVQQRARWALRRHAHRSEGKPDPAWKNPWDWTL